MQEKVRLRLLLAYDWSKSKELSDPGGYFSPAPHLSSPAPTAK
jgi:hypothetical protein